MTFHPRKEFEFDGIKIGKVNFNTIDPNEELPDVKNPLDFSEFTDRGKIFSNEGVRQIIVEVATRTLEVAADKAESVIRMEASSIWSEVDKESILSLKDDINA